MMSDYHSVAGVVPEWVETRTRRAGLTTWNDCYEGGMGNLRYPDEVIVQSIHHLGLHPYQAKKALDLGCGSGRHLEMLHRQGYEVWAVDGEERALKLVQSRWELPGLHTVQMRFPPVKFPDGFLDLVLMVNVLEHNVAEDREELVREVYRMLGSGGTFISRHAGWTGAPPDGATKQVEERSWQRDKDTFVHLYTESELLEIMVEVGFSGVQVGSRRGTYPWLKWVDEKEIYVVATKA